MKKAHVQFHRDGYGPSHPAINIKVRKGLDDGIRELRASEHTPARFSEDWIRANLSDDAIHYCWNDACERNFDFAKDEAKEIFGNHVEVYTEGRSSGWLVVHNLPEFETWNAPMLAKWEKFSNICQSFVDDVPYQCVWDIYHNIFLAEEEKREQEIRDAMVTE